jgi:hypothetical protein
MLIKFAGYILFIFGGFLFYFKGTKKPDKDKSKLHTFFIFAVSFLLLSYLYWFEI